MTHKRLNSTTAIVLVVSFMQPLPALAQSTGKALMTIPAERLAPAIACLEKRSGNPNEAEGECLAELTLSQAVCDPAMLETDVEKGASLEKAAARIVQSVNASACSRDGAVSANIDVAADMQGEADAAAKAAELAKAADELLAQGRADDDAAAATQAEADAVALAAELAKAADATALAEAEANGRADAEATARAQEEAIAQAKKAEEVATAEAAARLAAESRECAVELVDAGGDTLCADNMSQAEISVVTAGVGDASNVEVTNKTVSDGDTRSSSDEFVDQAASSKADGPSNLEKAGLVALGALVIGAVLSNGRTVTAKTGDRVVVQDEYGNYSVLKDDDILVRDAGSDVRTETFGDGSTRSFVTRSDGIQIVTIRDAQGQVLRRTRIDTDGTEVLLIDDTRPSARVDVQTLPSPIVSNLAYRDANDAAGMRAALLAAQNRDLGRSFSLSQVRQYQEVRTLAPEINLDSITFQTASAAIQPSEAEQLSAIGLLMVDLIQQNPRELFLIEGYTDAVGDESYNLLLSDRRAESVALALSEYFGARPENMVVQGYGERFPLIPTLNAERLNRRVAVRRITDLIQPN